MENFFKKLCKGYDLVAIILFGSSATGKINKLSDIDIAFLPQKRLNNKQEDSLFLKISKFYQRDDIDLVDLTKADIVLKYAAINSGKILACTNQKIFYNFILKTRSEYLDTQHIRTIYAYYLNRRIAGKQFGGLNENSR